MGTLWSGLETSALATGVVFRKSFGNITPRGRFLGVERWKIVDDRFFVSGSSKGQRGAKLEQPHEDMVSQTSPDVVVERRYSKATLFFGLRILRPVRRLERS